MQLFSTLFSKPKVAKRLSAQKKEVFAWLVSCKDFSTSKKSVAPKDIVGLYDRAIEHKCHGVLLAVTTPCTDQTVEQLRSFESASRPVSTMIWDTHKLSEILAKRREKRFRFTLARFFPKSSGLSSQLKQLIDVAIDRIGKRREGIREKVEELCEFGANLNDQAAKWMLIHKGLEKLRPSLDCLYPVIDLYMKQFNSPTCQYDFLAWTYIDELLEDSTREALESNPEARVTVDSCIVFEEFSYIRKGDCAIVEIWGWRDPLPETNTIENDMFLAEARFSKDSCAFTCRPTSVAEVNSRHQSETPTEP